MIGATLKILTGMAKEEWNIQFDSNAIIIGSNKRKSKSYSLLELSAIKFTKIKPQMGSSHTICLFFDSINQKIYIELPILIWYSIADEDDLNVFLQFVDDFRTQVIEPQFDFFSGCEQKTIGSGAKGFDLPTKYVFVRKDDNKSN